MNTTRLEKTYALVLAAIFGLIVLHAPLSVGLGTLFPHYDLLIKSWKEILMVVVLPLAMVIISKRRLWSGFLHDRIFYVIVSYVLLHVITLLVLYQGAAATAAGLAIDLRYVLFFSLVYVLLKVAPQYRRRMIQIGSIGACIVVGFATLQLFLPADILTHIGYSNSTIAPYLTVDKNTAYIRVNSTLRGPNPLGAYAGMVLALLAAAWARGKLRGRAAMVAAAVIATCSAIALWISYSRSSLVAGIIAVAIVFIATFGRKLSWKSLAIGAMLVCIVVGTFIAVSGSTILSNVLLHENPNGGSSVNSNEQHAQSLTVGFAQLIHEPIGSGIGSTGSASLHGTVPIIIENQYLFVAHEVGWLGIALFISLFVMILVRAWRRRDDWLSLGVFASGIGLSLIGLLLPVWVDDTVSIVWWGLAAIAIAERVYERKATK